MIEQLLYEAVTNMTAPFATCIVAVVIGITVVFISRNIRRSISESARYQHEYEMEKQRNIKLIEGKKNYE